MKIPKLTEQEQVIVNIIADHVLFARIANAMHNIINAVNPSDDEEFFKPDMKHKGIHNALDLLGITYKEQSISDTCRFRDELYNVFTQEVYGEDKIENHEEIAYSVFFTWSSKIREYYTTRKAS